MFEAALMALMLLIAFVWFVLCICVDSNVNVPNIAQSYQARCEPHSVYQPFSRMTSRLVSPSHEHLRVPVHQIIHRVRAQPQLPQGPFGMIFLTCQGRVDVCLIVSLTHTIDNVKAEIHQLLTIGLPQCLDYYLRFTTQGPQRRSVRRQIQVLPNMYLVGHLLQAQFGGPHAPVIEPGWRMNCVVTVSPPRRFKISHKRPVFHDYYDNNDNNDNKRPRSHVRCESDSD